MDNGTLSASDVALLSGNNGFGFGDGGAFMWIFALLILAGGGFNGWGNNGFANAIGYENLATSNEVQRGFDNQNSMANQREILSAVNAGTAQAVTPTTNAPAIVNLGTATHGYGCGIKLSGNAIMIDGSGYFKVDCSISVAPIATGAVTVALYDGNEQIDGAVAYGSVSTANNPVTLPLFATIRRGCNCNGADSITVRVIEGEGNVQNVAVRVEKS